MNLIICLTPLQVLIAKRIIELHPHENFYGVMISEQATNNKYLHAYRSLSESCQNSHYWDTTQLKFRKGLLGKVSLANIINKIIDKRKFDNVFVASFSNGFVQYILSNCEFSNLYTFDDGTMSLIPNSCLTQKDSNKPLKPIKKIKKWFYNRFILKDVYTTEKLKNISVKHFSIFKQNANFEKLEYLSLFSKKTKNVLSDKETKKILIGQPDFFFDEKLNIQLVEYAIEHFKIDEYYPHPREEFHLTNANYINSDLIFEEYLLQAAEECDYEVYTFFSTVGLNIANWEGTKVIALKPSHLTYPAFVETYEIFKQFNIPIIEFSIPENWTLKRDIL